jgi:hypothetical protein
MTNLNTELFAEISEAQQEVVSGGDTPGFDFLAGTKFAQDIQIFKGGSTSTAQGSSTGSELAIQQTYTEGLTSLSTFLK